MSFARLSNYRQSPRKVRLVADVVRGMKITEATAILDHLDKRAAPVVKKVLKSAETNALHNFNINKEDLFVFEIRVDEGPTLKRHRPRARGRAFPIRKRTSHIMVQLKVRGGIELDSAIKKEKEKITVKDEPKQTESINKKQETKDKKETK